MRSGEGAGEGAGGVVGMLCHVVQAEYIIVIHTYCISSVRRRRGRLFVLASGSKLSVRVHIMHSDEVCIYLFVYTTIYLVFVSMLIVCIDC